MDVQSAIALRRTAHSFASTPLPEGALDRALEAAIWAPCHRKTWPWRFWRTGPQTRQQLAEVAIQVKSEKAGAPLDAARQDKMRRFLTEVPELLVVGQQRSDDAFQSKEDYAAVACALQNLHLAVTAEGLAGKWSTGAPTRAPATYRLLGLDPEVVEIVGFFLVGYPEKVPSAPERPALESFVTALP